MPDKQGRLSQAEVKSALAWMKKKLKVKTCPLCGDSDLTLSNRIAAVPMWGTEALITSITTPMLQTTCPTCGHIRYFSAMMAEIVPKQKPKG
jgi:hypothetical protein